MKKIFVVCIMLAAMINVVTAQERQRQSAEDRAKTQTERIERLLSLTADQKTKIHAINLDLAKQWETKMQNAQGNRDARLAITQEIEKLRDAKYKDVLTADQFKKYLDDNERRM